MTEAPSTSSDGGKGSKFGRKRMSKNGRPYSLPSTEVADPSDMNFTSENDSLAFSADEFASVAWLASSFGFKINGDSAQLLTRFQ